MSYELPDFDDMAKKAEEVCELARKKGLLAITLKLAEAEIVSLVTSSPLYFKDGKSPSMSFIESTYKFTGIDNNLIPLRKEYEEVCSQYDFARFQYDIMKLKVDVWRTASANERLSLL